MANPPPVTVNTDPPIQVGGDDSFVMGMNSYTAPLKLTPGEYVLGMNLICRGGLAQTRPGSRSLTDLPAGNFQGFTMFTPSGGVPHLVSAIEGKLYASPFPFTTYFQIPNIQFAHFSRFVSWASCVKSTDYDDAGTLKVLDNPYSILIIQDGNTRAAYWDGVNSGHLNPTYSGGTVTKKGYDETVVGLWMVWSNNRLWVSRRGVVIASDIGNPTKFTEAQFLAEARAFYLPGDCTGMAELSDRTGIIAFTSDTGTFFQTNIQDRTKWLSTDGFTSTILPKLGCVSPKSIVEQYGLLWWFTSKGLVNQNDALRTHISSRTDIQDNEMIQSKYNLSYDLYGVCGGYFENFLFHAVPNGDKLNTRLHVLDQAPFDESPQNAWPAYWEGWRPVEFARGVLQGQERVFCGSQDYDGVNRIWELFKEDKTDNGVPITCFLVTRPQLFENRDFKRFRYAEIEMANILGPVAVMAAAAGLKGAFQPILSKDINATNGQVYADSQYGFNANELNGVKPQTRVIRTQDKSEATECNSACVESDLSGLVDKAFNLLIAWSGSAGVSAVRLFAQGEPQGYQGTCELDETGEDRLLTPAGCGANAKFSSSEPFITYTATATFTKNDPDTGIPVSKTLAQSSMISQVDANRKAQAGAEWYVLNQIGEL